MQKYERIQGSKEGARAELHVYDGDKCKIEMTVSHDIAKQIMSVAVAKGGSYPTMITIDGKSFACDLVGARIDSFGIDHKRIGGTGVIEFGSLKKRT